MAGGNKGNDRSAVMKLANSKMDEASKYLLDLAMKNATPSSLSAKDMQISMELIKRACRSRKHRRGWAAL